MKKLLHIGFMISMVLSTQVFAASPLPLLGLQVSNGTMSFRVMSASGRALFKNAQWDDVTGEQILIARDRNPAFSNLLQELQTVTDSWGCKKSIFAILEKPDYQSLKPIVLFDDEVSPAFVACLQ